MLGIRYDSASGREFARQVAEHMRNTAYGTSAELAKRKGAFPLFDAQQYLNGAFAQRLPAELAEWKSNKRGCVIRI